MNKIPAYTLGNIKKLPVLRVFNKCEKKDI